MATMQSVATGQAPTTLERKIASQEDKKFFHTPEYIIAGTYSTQDELGWVPGIIHKVRAAENLHYFLRTHRYPYLLVAGSVR